MHIMKYLVKKITAFLLVIFTFLFVVNQQTALALTNSNSNRLQQNSQNTGQSSPETSSSNASGAFEGSSADGGTSIDGGAGAGVPVSNPDGDPDLVVESVSHNSGTVTVVVKNNGQGRNAPAGKFDVKVEMPHKNGQTMSLDTWSVSGLGKSQTFTGKSVFTNWQDGKSFQITVDVYNKVRELNESNNQKTLEIPKPSPTPTPVQQEKKDNASVGLLPDSPFYFVKEAGRALASTFTFDKEKKVILHASFAEEKAKEAVALADKGKTDLALNHIKSVDKDLVKVDQLTNDLLKKQPDKADKLLSDLSNKQAETKASLDKIADKAGGNEAAKLALDNTNQAIEKVTKQEANNQNAEQRIGDQTVNILPKGVDLVLVEPKISANDYGNTFVTFSVDNPGSLPYRGTVILDYIAYDSSGNVVYHHKPSHEDFRVEAGEKNKRLADRQTNGGDFKKVAKIKATIIPDIAEDKSNNTKEVTISRPDIELTELKPSTNSYGNTFLEFYVSNESSLPYKGTLVLDHEGFDSSGKSVYHYKPSFSDFQLNAGEKNKQLTFIQTNGGVLKNAAKVKATIIPDIAENTANNTKEVSLIIDIPDLTQIREATLSAYQANIYELKEATFSATQVVGASQLANIQVLPCEPLYVVKDFGRGLESLLTFGEENKAKLALQNANEKAAEAAEVAASDKKNSDSCAAGVLNDAAKEIEKTNKLIEDINKKSPDKAKELADLALGEQFKQQKVAGDLVKDATGDGLIKVKEARDKTLESMANTVEIVGNADKIKEAMKGSGKKAADPLSPISDLEVLVALEDKLKVDKKEVLKDAKDDSVGKIKQVVESLPDDKKGIFKDYVKASGGDETNKLKVIDEIRREGVEGTTKTVLINTRDTVIDNLETKLEDVAKKDNNASKKLLSDLGDGSIEDLRVLADLDKELHNKDKLAFNEVKEESVANFANEVKSLDVAKKDDFAKEAAEKFTDLKQLKVYKQLGSSASEEDKKVLHELDQALTEEIKEKVQEKTNQQAKEEFLATFSERTPDDLAYLKELSGSFDKNIFGELVQSQLALLKEEISYEKDEYGDYSQLFDDPSYKSFLESYGGYFDDLYSFFDSYDWSVEFGDNTDDSGNYDYSDDASQYDDPTTEHAECDDNYDPVCGEDGQTYDNACYAEKQYSVKVAYNGECKDESSDSASYDSAGSDEPSGAEEEPAVTEDTGEVEGVSTHILPGLFWRFSHVFLIN